MSGAMKLRESKGRAGLSETEPNLRNLRDEFTQIGKMYYPKVPDWL